MNPSKDKFDNNNKKNSTTIHSMNDSLFNRILKDKLKRENITNLQDSLTSKASNDKNLNLSSRNNNDSINKNIFSQTLETEKPNSCDRINTIPKTLVKSALNSQKNFKKKTNKFDLFGKIKTELISSKKEKNNKDIVLHKNTQIILEQYMESQIINSKLQNEIKILNEKINSLKRLDMMKKNEIEMINKKFREIIDKFNKDLEDSKKKYSEYTFFKELNDKLNLCLKSTINILIEILGIVIVQKINSVNYNNRNSINTNNSMSIDIYDSYNNEGSFIFNLEDKKSMLIDQIYNIVNAKLIYMKNDLNIDIEKEFDKLKKWNIHSNRLEDSISNIKFSMKKEASENIFTHRNSENNYNSNSFELNSSQKIFSPKFFNNNINTSINEICREFNGETDSKKNTNINNQTLNDSMLKDLNSVQIGIPEEIKEFNFENGSIKRDVKLSLELNENPTDFNIDLYFSGNTNNSTINGYSKPIIFSPIFGNHKKESLSSNNNISFMDF